MQAAERAGETMRCESCRRLTGCRRGDLGPIGTIHCKTAQAVGVVENSAERTTKGARVVDQTRESFQCIDAAVREMTIEIGQLAELVTRFKTTNA